MPKKAAEARATRRRTTPAPAVPPGENSAVPETRPPPRRRPSTRRAEVNHELVTELRALRAAMDEMIDRYRLRVGGRLSDVILLLDGDPAIGTEARPLATRIAHAMVQELRDMPLKPRKGRPKDFRRLEALVEELAAEAGER